MLKDHASLLSVVDCVSTEPDHQTGEGSKANET
jgi:hypothetical protein